MSLLNSAYYHLKPLVPLRLRHTMRRLQASYKLLNCQDWPISQAAGGRPSGWPGWPEGKRFAFVLTHDVESQRGLERCQELARFDADLGFRASFNFIPEGEYQAPAALRQELVTGGFEVGVHDLKHDGSLYRSRRRFAEAAERINAYLSDWQAVGFRAGFMFHNLEWLRDLRIEYDASTFDTDPFEPQPEGVHTIFPFWVPGRTPGTGYVELPYTLSQDSTLFVILKEKTIDTWRRKLDWIAARGGLALLNVHPDYLSFSRRRLGPSEFSSLLYEELLTYLRERYEGQYWHVRPKDLAAWFKSSHMEEGGFAAGRESLVDVHPSLKV
jgi:hypothetical protein